MNKQIIGVIPARFASTRLSNKLLISISGKSLIQRTYENAKKISLLTDLVIATDDVRIYDHAQSFGAKVVMTSIECLNGTERLAEALALHPQWLTAQAIVNIQGDEPCIDPLAVNQAIELLLQDESAQMATLATLLTNEEDASNPSIVKCVFDKHFNALYFSRALIPSNKLNTFQKKTTYYRHIGLYVYKPTFIMTYQTLQSTPLQLQEDLEQLKVLEHGFRIKIAITSTPSIGVDLPEDIQKVEKWICQQNTYL